jgi:hypothetical protein
LPYKELPKDCMDLGDRVKFVEDYLEELLWLTKKLTSLLQRSRDGQMTMESMINAK